MRGTQRVGSLLRLFFGAAFLCLVWVLFSAAQADAAERPAPATPARPATPAALVASVAKPVKTPATETVDAAAQSLKAVAAAVPSLEAPVVVVADAVVTVADSVPVVGRDPLVDVPLPDPSEAPLPVKLPELGALDQATDHRSADSPATQRNQPPEATLSTVSRRLARASFDADVSSTGRRAAAAVNTSPRSAAPEPADAPEPFPFPQSPMPPTNSVPNPGGGASSADVASIGPAIALPRLTLSGSSSSDWRVPRGLSAQPGSRPD